MNVNARHHSLGLIAEAGPPRIHHVMAEYLYWDDVGRAYDLALAEPERIAVSLGRHLNDHVTSFYLWTPDDFFIELGWAGRSIDDATWQPHEIAAPSLWGHVRYWQTAAKREQTQKQAPASVSVAHELPPRQSAPRVEREQLRSAAAPDVWRQLAPSGTGHVLLPGGGTMSRFTGGPSSRICWVVGYCAIRPGSTCGGRKDQSSLFSSLSARMVVSAGSLVATLNACS